MSDQIPSDLIEFFVTQIDSLEEFEILLLTAAEPNRVWTAVEVDATIRSSPASVSTRLASLAAKGFLEEREPGAYRFAPKSEALADLVNQAATAYKSRRMQVTEAIFSKPLGAILTFADAFRFKKEKKDG